MLSLWMAVVACLMGCTLPAFAKSDSVPAASIQEQKTQQNESGLMADMENCPHHHSDGGAPAKPHGGKPVRGGAISCCPLEITVAPKWDAVALGIVPHVLLLRSNFSLMVARLYASVEIESRVWHSGRDTLLETQLLRV
jgi:hypothetical protein